MPKIFVLTGAGISAESGVPTFRGSSGLWEGHRIEEVATPEAFRRNPSLVHRFYNQRRIDIQSREPNLAHRSLARLESVLGNDFTLVTQNVDDLHERGGSNNVIHMHGELLKVFCTRCRAKANCRTELTPESTCDKCSAKGTVRPDIVWFGEVPYHMEQVEAALTKCDLFAAIGTSAMVYPAAGFVDIAISRGVPTIEFNLTRTDASSYFTENRFGPATETVSKWVEEILA